MRAAALRSYRELLQAAWVREVPVGPVDETLTRVGRILREAGIHFAVAGGFAVIEHGYERFTKDVELLVHAGDLSRAMKALRAAGFRGGLGLGAFRRLLRDRRFHGLPMCIETPKGPDLAEDRRNLAVLRRLA